METTTDPRPMTGPIEIPEDPWVTTTQAAAWVDRPVRTIEHWVRQGLIPAKRNEPPYPSLMRLSDVARASNQHARWGVTRGRKRTLTTQNGKTIQLRGQAATRA